MKKTMAKAETAEELHARLVVFEQELQGISANKQRIAEELQRLELEAQRITEEKLKVFQALKNHPDFYAFLIKDVEPTVSDDTLIDILHLAPRWSNCLKTENIYYIHDLTERTETELLKIPNMGKRGLNEIKEALHAHGLKLKGSS